MPSGRPPSSTATGLLGPPAPDVEHLDGAVEAGLVGPGVVDEPRRHRVRDVGGEDQVAAPQRDRVHAQRPRAGVHQRLHREHRRGPRDPAVGPGRAGVRRDAAHRALVVGELVGPGEQAAGHERLDPGGPRVDRVRAGVAPDVGGDGEQLPVGGEAGAQHVAVVAGVGGREQVLDAVLDPLQCGVRHRDRHEAERHVLGVEHRLDAEPAPDVGRDHPDVALGQPEQLGELGADEVGHLGAGPERRGAGRRPRSGRPRRGTRWGCRRGGWW